MLLTLLKVGYSAFLNASATTERKCLEELTWTEIYGQVFNGCLKTQAEAKVAQLEALMHNASY